MVKLVAAFFTAADIPNKEVYKKEEIKKFSELVFPLILWETANRIKSVMRLVDFNTEDDIIEVPNKIPDQAQFIKNLPARREELRADVINRQGKDVDVKIVDKDKEAVNKAVVDFTEKAKMFTETPKSSNNFLTRLYQTILKDPCGKRAKRREEENRPPGSGTGGLTKRDSVSATSKQHSDMVDRLAEPRKTQFIIDNSPSKTYLLEDEKGFENSPKFTTEPTDKIKGFSLSPNLSKQDNHGLKTSKQDNDSDESSVLQNPYWKPEIEGKETVPEVPQQEV